MKGADAKRILWALFEGRHQEMLLFLLLYKKWSLKRNILSFVASLAWMLNSWSGLNLQTQQLYGSLSLSPPPSLASDRGPACWGPQPYWWIWWLTEHCRVMLRILKKQTVKALLASLRLWNLDFSRRGELGKFKILIYTLALTRIAIKIKPKSYYLYVQLWFNKCETLIPNKFCIL